MTVPVTLATSRLSLRELDTGDYDDVRALDADPDVQWWRGARTITPEESRGFLADLTAERARAPRWSPNGFATLRLRRIWARVNPGNAASCRVVEKGKSGVASRGIVAPVRVRRR